MCQLAHLSSYIVSHQAAIILVLGSIASLLSTIKQLLSPTSKAASILDAVIDLLSFRAPPGRLGLFKSKWTVPGLPSINEEYVKGKESK